MLRVLDVVFLAKGQDGTVEGLEVGANEDFGSLLASTAPSGSQNAGRSVAVNGAASGPAGSGMPGVQAWADSVEPGTGVAFVLVEHLLYQRLGVHSRDEAVGRARTLGLLRR